MPYSACLLSRKVAIETFRNFASADMVALSYVSSMGVGRIFSRGGEEGDFPKIFSRGAKIGEICFLPLEIEKTTFFC